ncbi:hypothetical protein TWF703_006742 [Orbilia oligospora]|uniref:Uncharacterized protein n=1 Tax=Orbilia oligospora TaxID=2813651 RepID=A0A7C8K837_ORBOL|nr:hypothetical protein TWF703_006742 [Orbilia oligospora]
MSSPSQQHRTADLSDEGQERQDDSDELGEDALQRYLEGLTYILKGGDARFIPQWDEQIIGYDAASNAVRDQNNPPKPTPPTELELYPCTDCGLVWIGGHENSGLTNIHPSHSNHVVHPVNPCRSILVYTKGICRGGGTPDAKAAIGVYFGPGSPHNRSILVERQAPGSQIAEIAAVVEAMRYMRTVILPRRKEILRESLRTRSRHLSSFIASASGVTSNESIAVRLIIATDYQYLVECLCKPRPLPKMQQQIRDQFCDENVPKDNEGFSQILSERRKLSIDGALVTWYCIDPSLNSMAKELAESGLGSTSTGLNNTVATACKR